MMIADGNLLGFFGRPVAGVLGVATLLIWSIAIIRAVQGLLKRKSDAGLPDELAS
jgi:hypothetical protein